jgi:acetylornithine deacetylase/succinyl-diaminopimelate desuccinylase-like protein
MLSLPSAPALRRIHAALRPVRARLQARDEEILRSQVEVSEIAAPTGDEGRRARWVTERFRALRLTDVHVDGAGNVLGTRQGASEGSPVVVCAHLDTVFPSDTPLAVRRDGARLAGPGIGDNGRGLAAMLGIASELDGRRVRLTRPVLFAATTGEEGAGDLRGAKHLFANGRRAAAAIALDGAGDERVVHHALGALRFRVEFRGTGGHSWSAFGLANPVHAAAQCAARIAALPLPREPRTTLSVTRIGGGLSVNAIPAEGWLEVDIRSTAPAVLERLAHDVHRLADAAAVQESQRRARGTRALAVRVERIGERPCGTVPAEHPLVQLAFEATRLVGRVPESGTASTDANIPISLGIPAITIGAGGRGGDIHTRDEWFDNTDGSLGLARALTIVVGVAGLEKVAERK